MEYKFVYHHVYVNYDDLYENMKDYVFMKISGNYLYIITEIRYIEQDDYTEVYENTIKIFKINDKYYIRDFNIDFDKCYEDSDTISFMTYHHMFLYDFGIDNDNIQYYVMSVSNESSGYPFAHYNFTNKNIKYYNDENDAPKIQEMSYCEKYEIQYDKENNILQYKLNDTIYRVSNISNNISLHNNDVFKTDDSDIFIYVNSQNHLVILFRMCTNTLLKWYKYYMLIIEENSCLIEIAMDKEFNDKVSDSIHTFYPTIDDNFIVIILK